MRVDRERVFFTSDLHFNHRNIIEYTNRPWRDRAGNPDVESMNQALVNNWNSVIRDEDKVFILGDLAMGGPNQAERVARYLDRMRGEKYLIPGNHDSYVLNPPVSDYLNILPPLFEIKVSDPDAPKNRQYIVMCHYAMKVWNRSHHGAWHLYGHSHHTMPPDYNIKAIDVGIDGKGYDYRPLSYDQVKNLMSMHGQERVDHHSSRTN
jgi:calcineurin-like phosphoesterase family protein